MPREYLKKGTWVRFPGGECYQIRDAIGEGGSSLLYSACKMTFYHGVYVVESPVRYALKECFPYTPQYCFKRQKSGEIHAVPETKEAETYLRYVSSMQLNEGRIAAEIYATEAVRLLPVQQMACDVEISVDQGRTFHTITNTFTVMASLEQKGEAVSAWKEKMRRPAAAVFEAIRELLLALREVHRAGYLHLDLQEGNIFIAGDWRDQSITCFLIDFGSARKMLEDGQCEPVGNQPVFSSVGYRAPEILEIRKREGDEIRLGKEADLYSVGYLLLYLLTGEHYSEKTMDVFQNAHDKKYLTRKNLEELKIPGYLEESIQHILRAALEKNPENRYHSADEMLKDVDRILQELLLQHSNLRGFTYDAYILYDSGKPQVKKAAETLQKELEHLKVSGCRRIRRVFLDSTEVSADQNANRQIVDALAESGYLIVLGSDAEEEMIWQCGEVQYFRKTHDPSRVLSMLIGKENGEEEQTIVKRRGQERYPSYVAVVRGKNDTEIQKKIKKDAAFRIAAPVLGIPYDGLVQRYRSYRRKKIRRIAGAISIAAIMVLSHAAYQQYHIQMEHKIAARNRAQNLCAQALQQYEMGDKKEALKTALLLSEEEKNAESAVIPEQMYTLNTILNIYASDQEETFVPENKLKKAFTTVVFSPDQRYGYGLDAQAVLTIFSCENGETIWTGDSRKMDQKVEQAFPLETAMTFGADMSAGAGELFAYLSSDQEVCVYNWKTGQKQNGISRKWLAQQLETEEFDLQINGISLSNDGNQMAVCTNAGTVWYDLQSNERSVLTKNPGESICFDAKGNVQIIEYQELEETAHVSNFWKDTTYVWEFAQYDPVSGERIGQENPGMGGMTGYRTDEKGQRLLSLEGQETEKEFWISWIRNELQLADPESGAFLGSLAFPANLVEIQPYTEDKFLVCLSDGSVWTVQWKDTMEKRRIYESGLQPEGFLYDPVEERAVLYTSEEVVFCGKPQDDGMEQQSAAGLFGASYVISDMEEMTDPSGQEKYQCVWFADAAEQSKTYGFWLEKNAAALYLPGEKTPVFQYACGENSEIRDLQLKEVQGGLCAVILETGREEGQEFAEVRVFSVSSGEQMTVYRLDDPEIIKSLKSCTEVIFMQEAEGIYLLNAGKLFFVDLKAKSMWPLKELEQEKEQVLFVSATKNARKDGQKGNVKDENVLEILSEKEEQIFLTLYSMEEKEILTRKALKKTSDNVQQPVMERSSDGTLLALFLGEDEITILDARTLEERQKISCGEAAAGQKKNVQLKFFGNDRYLLGADQEAVWLYEVKTGKLISTYALGKYRGEQVLSADQNGNYFSLKDRFVFEDTNTTEGIDDQMKLHLFYVEHGQIYPFAEIRRGYKLPDSSQIYSIYENEKGFSSGKIQDFSRLYEKAEKELGN